MSKECNITIKPDDISLKVPYNSLIADILEIPHIHTEMPCGGAGICGKCKVIATGALSEKTEAEQKISKEDNVRLACVTRVLGDAIIYIPDSSRSIKQKILTLTNTRETEIKNNIKKLHITLKEPVLGEDDSEITRIKKYIKSNFNLDITVNYRILSDLSKKIRSSKYDFTCVLFEEELIAVEKGNTETTCYGIAFDIGSTTLAGYMLDLNSGEIISVSSMMNPQIFHGDDLISRINFINTNENGLKTLQNAVLRGLNLITREICENAEISPENIYKATLVGNTCMSHICLGINPFTLGESPYIPTVSNGVIISAYELGLTINPCGRLCFLPNIAGFVGSDTVGVILSDMKYDTGETTLAVDIGTNGEMALRHNNKLIVCSAAAGPAFEGAGISCGMRGGPGAIDKVTITDDVNISVINNIKALGICGSGLLDAVCEMVKNEIVDMTGRLVDKEEFFGNENLKDRIIIGKNGNEFILVYAKDSGTGEDITLKHSDIRSMQLAKGSIHAAIKTLLSYAKIKETDLTKILIAGGFGNYLNKKSAVKIGLLPKIDLEKIISIGNGAGSGARLALISKDEYEYTNRILEEAQHIELALSNEYQMNLMDAMMFYPD